MVGVAARHRPARRRQLAGDRAGLRGVGASSKPPEGYDKRTMASDIHALFRDHLGITGKIALVGHDIGMMVAYAFASSYPDAADRLSALRRGQDWGSSAFCVVTAALRVGLGGGRGQRDADLQSFHAVGAGRPAR